MIITIKSGVGLQAAKQTVKQLLKITPNIHVAEMDGKLHIAVLGFSAADIDGASVPDVESCTQDNTLLNEHFEDFTEAWLWLHRRESGRGHTFVRR